MSTFDDSAAPAAEVDPATARWLTGEDGRAAVDAATAHLDAGMVVLTLVERLRAQHDDVTRIAAVVAAAEARRRARARWPDAERLLFTRAALEQASDPAVSRWRAARFAGDAVHDLCAGVGGDTIALAQTARRPVAVDRDAGRLALLEHNLRTVGLEVRIEHADVLALTLPSEALVHIDPSRRRGERRSIDPNAGAPAMDAVLAAHGHVAGMGFVCAPGVDTNHPALPEDAEVEYVQLGDRLIEAVVWTGELRRDGASARATLLDPGPAAAAGPVDGLVRAQQWRQGERPARLGVGEIGSHLVEVVPAAVRARLHDDIGRSIGAHRVAHRRALLTVDGAPPTSPWYRARPVLAQLAARPRAVRAWLTRNDLGPVELVLHGVEVDPGRWWQALGRVPRGPAGVRVELIRRDDDALAVVTDDRRQ